MSDSNELILTAAQARAIDRYAIETLGLPGIVLMENAAINAASIVLDILENAVELDRDRFVVSVLCGGGNNGGDGYAVARQLLGFGVEVRLCAVKPIAKLTGDALINAQVCERLRLSVWPCENEKQARDCRVAWASSHALVDAVLGTGVSSPIRRETAAVLEAVNATKLDLGDRLRVVSLDVPSGLDPDTGQASGAYVRADATVTFVAPKAGFEHPQARAALGRVIVADIGLPDSAVAMALKAVDRG
ncbi:MAG: NAD(P)H-hydrate epimerase [Planctomycetota bacterium]